jgi:predicted transport protein
MIVYFLIDSMEGKRDKRKLYTGQTAKGMTRFFDHKGKKDWWDKVVIFTAPKKYFDSDTIFGLENIMIERYKNSGLYIMDQEGSNREPNEDCEFFADQIIGIMDFLGYPLALEESNDSEECNVSKKEAVTLARGTSTIFNDLDKEIKSYNQYVISDQMKLYTAYKLGNKNICAVWVLNNGLEIELYIKLEDIELKNSGAFDITYRKRGHKYSAIKVTNDIEKANALAIIKQIIKSI